MTLISHIDLALNDYDEIQVVQYMTLVNFPVEYKSTKTILLEGNHLSISNDIKNLLDIQDANIIFEENCVKEGMLKGRAYKYITGKRTLDSRHCGIISEDYIIIKNGTQMSRITLL